MFVCIPAYAGVPTHICNGLAAEFCEAGGSNNVPTLLRGVFGSGKSRTLAACIVSLDRPFIRFRACLNPQK